MTEDADPELALETGGPTWKLWMRTGLAPADPAPLGRRALLLAALCWLPPFLFSLHDGLATGDSVALPFLRDFAVYARAIVAIILLVLADAAVARRLGSVLQQFHRARLLEPKAGDAFAKIVTDTRRRIDSTWIELALLGLSYLLAWSAMRRALATDVSTWRALVGESGTSLTLAGWWYGLVSAPLFQFLFLRWLFRWVAWGQLLARVARLDLRLVATHPDRAAGLGFLAGGQASFSILVLAASASLSAVLANEVIYGGVSLESLYPTMAAFAAIASLLVIVPLLAFTPRLIALKREALYAYGALSSRHDSAFQDKWIGTPTPSESLLGDPDPSSLADLATGYERAKALKPIPVDLAALVPIVLAAALPMVPLIAIKIPLKDILKGLSRIVL